MPFLWVAGIIILFDQLSKYMIRMLMYPGQTIPLIPKIFHLTYVQNPGAAFGMLAHRTSFFAIITLAVIIFILFFYYRLGSGRSVLRLGLALQLGGAVGNLIDRLYFGHVTDLFDFRIWPVFNIADMAIVLGVGLLCWEIINSSPEKKKQETS